MRTKNGENLMIFHAFIGIQSQFKNLGSSRTEFWWFLLKPLSLLSGTPSTVYLTTCVTCRVDSSTHSGYIYKPSWGPINRGKVQHFFHWNGFVTTPVIFNFNFSKNRDFWWFRQGYDEYSEFDVFKRSGVMSRCAGMSETWSRVP